MDHDGSVLKATIPGVFLPQGRARRSGCRSGATAASSFPAGCKRVLTNPFHG